MKKVLIPEIINEAEKYIRLLKETKSKGYEYNLKISDERLHRLGVELRKSISDLNNYLKP